MIDEAFLPFGEVVQRMLALPGQIVDDEAGVRSHVESCEIETPIELSVARDAEGRLVIGTVPPLYYVNTTVQPSYHRLRLSADGSGNGDGR